MPKLQAKGIIIFSLFILLSLFATARGAEAANICVGPSSSGNGSGSDWYNVAQWSTLTFTRGNTYYLQDGSYAGKTLNTAVSGSTYIYIKKATESAHGSATGWSSAYGDGVATFSGGAHLTITTSYWDINGVTGGGPSSWKAGHGIEFNRTFGAGSIAYIDTGTLTITNINIRHIYFHETGDTEGGPKSAGAIGFFNGGILNNSIFEYNYFDNLGKLPWFLRGGSGNIIQYNYTGNICGMSVFDYTDHCETMVFWTLSDTDIRFNFFTEAPSSGGIIRNGYPDTTSSDIRIYGNIIGNGAYLVGCNAGHCTDWNIFNNTFYNGSAGPIAGGAAQSFSYNAVNNVAYNFGIGYPPGNYSSFYKLTNSYCNSGAGALTSAKGFVIRQPNDCDIPDPNTSTYNRSPFVNTSILDFRLAAAEDAGANACTAASVNCNSTYPYNKDMLGNTRTTWSRGAYEYFSGGGDTTPPAAPQGLSVE